MRKHRGYFDQNKHGEKIERHTSWFAKATSKRRSKNKAAKQARKKNR